MNDQLIAQIESVMDGSMRFVDKASVASDRWLFLAALVALLFTMGIVIYWLVKSLEKKDAIHVVERVEWKNERNAEHTEQKNERKEDQKQYIDALSLFKSDLREMTIELKKNTEILVAHDRDMRAAHAVETQLIVEAQLRKMGISIPSKV